MAVAKDSVTPAHYGLRQRHLTEIADGSFVVSNQTTLAEWINHWLSIGAPGKKRPSVLFPIVAVAAFTGARRGEILALRWEDFNAEAKTLRIERAIEETQEHGLQIKGRGRKQSAVSVPLK